MLGTLSELVRRLCGWLPLLAVLATAQGCGGPDTKLITVRSPGVHHGVSLVVRNRSDSVIGGFFLAKTSVVKHTPGNSDLGSEAEAETWGNDLLSASLVVGAEQPVPVAEAGLWDARPVDEEGRYQHIAGLKLQQGRQYVLVLHDGGWRNFH